MTLRRIAFGFAFGLITSTAGLAAHAAAPAPEPKIVDTGIAEFDDVFGKARDIQGSITTQDQTLIDGRTNLNKALGLTDDGALKDALANLKTKLNGKVKLAMNGTWPHLEATDAIPDNAKAAVDAVNALSDNSAKTSDTADQLLPQSQALVDASAGFPAKVPQLIQNPLQVGKKTKVVNADVKAVAALPTRVNKLKTDAQGVATEISGAFTN